MADSPRHWKLQIPNGRGAVDREIFPQGVVVTIELPSMHRGPDRASSLQRRRYGIRKACVGVEQPSDEVHPILVLGIQQQAAAAQQRDLVRDCGSREEDGKERQMSAAIVCAVQYSTLHADEIVVDPLSLRFAPNP